MHRRRFFAASVFGLWLLRHGGPAMAANANILLANVYREGIDPADYWVSEKLDGVRGLWDGQSLRHRSGNPVHAPKWFTDALPPLPLDGELWIARQSFDKLSAIVRKDVPIDEEWRQVKYMIFEMPDAPGSFSERIALMHETIGKANINGSVPWLHPIAQFRIADRKALAAKLKELVKLGAEGLVLHRADAAYVTGRSDMLLKLKPMLDTEATVVGHIAGKGRHLGRMGALLVETPEGRRFRIGTGFSDADRANPPPIGAVVTYRYRDLTSTGLPKFVSYLRVRESF
ncbi:DNA ligase [Roseateles oligotrophus]|uniref:DNA ligase n=1 Tax=Roseateles oligotrophus TaxID=1769250 RepID=A0ABT2YDJ4_9BURK|nr:DNA ligase [Roseateles oligotrophus]MCV2368094.1 DNA ligase [Roseateles oligotrophus]